MSAGGGGAGGSLASADAVAPLHPDGVFIQQQLTTPASQDVDDPLSLRSGAPADVLASVVGTYAPTPHLKFPESITHGGSTWHVLKAGEKSWTSKDHAADVFDTFQGDEQDQRGYFVVRCRVCALSGHTATNILRGGKSSNAWRHFENFANSAQAGDLQRRRHASVVTHRSQTAHPHKATASGQNQGLS